MSKHLIHGCVQADIITIHNINFVEIVNTLVMFRSNKCTSLHKNDITHSPKLPPLPMPVDGTVKVGSIKCFISHNHDVCSL